MSRLAWSPYRRIDTRPLNLGVIVAVLLASLAAGFMGGLIVWGLWRFDLLQLGDDRREP